MGVSTYTVPSEDARERGSASIGRVADRTVVKGTPIGAVVSYGPAT